MAKKQMIRRFLLAVGKACGDARWTESGEDAKPKTEFTYDFQYVNVLEVDDTHDMGCCVSIWIDDESADPMLEVNDTDYVVGREGELYFRRRLRRCTPEMIAKRVMAILKGLRKTGFWAEQKREGDEFWSIYDSISEHLPPAWKCSDGRKENYAHGVFKAKGRRVMVTVEGEHKDIWLRGCGRLLARERFAGKERSPKRIAAVIKNILSGPSGRKVGLG